MHPFNHVGVKLKFYFCNAVVMKKNVSCFRDKVLQGIDSTIFNKPICEVLLNQKYFNGIGNYLRAEVLHRYY